MSAEPLVRAQALTRSFGRHQAVKRLDLELHKGEVLGLLGPNGAGKTTSLRMLTGCLASDEGEIFIGGFDLAKHPEKAKAQLGYLPEIPPLHKELSVREFLSFCARLHRLRGPALEQATEDALKACGLEAVSGQLIGSLSKGYQQRVGIAQAIVHKPAVIILDEPTVGLDPNQMRQIRELIRQLAENHAILLSSHILSEVQAVCDRVMIMAGGEVVHDGPLQAPSDSDYTLLLGMREPNLERLAEFAGVTEVVPLDAQQLRLHIAAGHDPRESIVLQATALGWGLYEIHKETVELEQIFAELTA